MCCPARARSRSECGRGSSARQTPGHVLRRPRSLPERVRMGEQRAPESPIQGISINRTNIVKSRDTTQRFLPFHPASVIARGSRSTRAALAHTPVSAARLGGGEGGRVPATALAVRVRASHAVSWQSHSIPMEWPKSRCCYYRLADTRHTRRVGNAHRTHLTRQ